MNYNLRTKVDPAGRIVQSLSLEMERSVANPFGVVEDISRHIIDVRDEQVKTALRQLGWTHRDDIAALDIPNNSEPFVIGGTRFGSAPTYHRVTVADILLMEEYIRTVKNAALLTKLPKL